MVDPKRSGGEAGGGVRASVCVLPSSNCTESRVSGRLEGSLLCASSINGKLGRDSYFSAHSDIHLRPLYMFTRTVGLWNLHHY
jgi:hypothetical protein